MTNIESFLFNIKTSKQMPFQGALLIAEPFLREGYFCHAVICLVEYSHQSNTMGIVMNKPTKYVLSDIIPDIYSHNDFTVYCGGPLSCDRLYFIHTLGNVIPNSQKITDGLYIGGDFNTVIELINQHNVSSSQIRFFLGYSGWDKGQLENEIKHHVWAITSPHSKNDILDGENDKYWHRYVKSMGDEYKGWQYHPENPQLN